MSKINGDKNDELVVSNNQGWEEWDERKYKLKGNIFLQNTQTLRGLHLYTYTHVH